MSVENCLFRGLVPQGQKASDYDNLLNPVPQDKMLFLQQKRQISVTSRVIITDGQRSSITNKFVEISTSCQFKQRRKLVTDPENVMFGHGGVLLNEETLKEQWLILLWIEAMQDELIQFDRLKVLDVKETKNALQCLQQEAEYCALSASCASINVDEDTASRLWLQYNNSTVVCDLSVSHMQSHATPEQHSRPKHIHYSVQFIKEQVENCHKVVRLGINPMIQPEPEDLPKDNPKLEIAVLRWQYASSLRCTKTKCNISSLEHNESINNLGRTLFHFQNTCELHQTNGKPLQMSSSNSTAVGDLDDSYGIKGQTVVTATSIPFKCSIYEDILSRKLKI
ncbi:hypothetical protein Tco_0972378 [Tanacetum coccineum]